MLEVYHEAFITEIRRRLIGECQERTLKCLDLLSEEEIWYRPNELSNSVGNLVLHLCGNVRQWLHSTLGGIPDTRQRQSEFDQRTAIPASELKNMIQQLMLQSDKILKNTTPAMLMDTYSVQGFAETGVSILVHITEHFSYHVGQITYFIKAHKSLDTGYYEGQDLDATS